MQFLADDQCEGMVAATPGAELHGCWWRGGAVLHWYSLYSSWRTPSEVQGRKAEPCTDLSSADTEDNQNIEEHQNLGPGQ